MFFKPSVFGSISLVRLQKNHISASACLEHACKSKQIKEALHSIQNFLGRNLGKIFVLSQCCLWVMLFYHPKKLCDDTFLYSFAGSENPSEVLQQPSPYRGQGKPKFISFSWGRSSVSAPCPVCAALPLGLPALRQRALLMACRAWLILNSLPTVGLCQLPCAGKCEGCVTSSKEMLTKYQVPVFLQYVSSQVMDTF